jgi:hypothetical protein
MPRFLLIRFKAFLTSLFCVINKNVQVKKTRNTIYSLLDSSTDLVTGDASFEKEPASSSILKCIVFGGVVVKGFYKFE